MAAAPESERDGAGEAGRAGPRAVAGTVTIRCRLDGPLVVELPDDPSPAERPAEPVRVRVTDHLGREFPLPAHKRAVALCRCGHTQSRPFCDGSHKAAGFVAAETAPGG